AFLTHMWAVTVTGAPKTWAMQFIEDHERAPRRWYGGAVGMMGFDGSMNTGLTLRTAHIEDGVATVRAGATLLFDSDPAAEEAEARGPARTGGGGRRSVGSGTPSGSGTRRPRGRRAPRRGPAGAAGRPPGLVRAHAGGLFRRAGGAGHHPARRVPGRRAGRLPAGPGGGGAGPRPPIRLRLRAP